MKIVINSKENKKLLQNFPQDPYADITIISQYSKLRLVLAFLSIDSQYFANLDPDTKQVNLSHLNQQPLIKVLKSLYGAQLIAYSVQQLIVIYEIIKQLQIQEYKNLLNQSLHQILASDKQNPLLNSIQLLQFCINNNILVQEMKNFHFDTKLKILQSSKNYLQLNKLSQVTLSNLLLNFNQLKIQKGDQIINHILENYFNRKNIRPAVYFANQTLQELKAIWEKFHHKITTVSQFTSSSSNNSSVTLSNTVGTLNRLNSLSSIQTQMRKSQTNLNNVLKAPLQTVTSTIFKSQITQNSILDSKITHLQNQLKSKDQLIKKLKEELKTIKLSKTITEVDSDHQESQTSLLTNLKNHKKTKKATITNLDNIREVQSFQASKDPHNAARVFGKNGPKARIFQGTK